MNLTKIRQHRWDCKDYLQIDSKHQNIPKFSNWGGLRTLKKKKTNNLSDKHNKHNTTQVRLQRLFANRF